MGDKTGGLERDTGALFVTHLTVTSTVNDLFTTRRALVDTTAPLIMHAEDGL